MSNFINAIFVQFSQRILNIFCMPMFVCVCLFVRAVFSLFFPLAVYFLCSTIFCYWCCFCCCLLLLPLFVVMANTILTDFQGNLQATFFTPLKFVQLSAAMITSAHIQWQKFRNQNGEIMFSVLQKAAHCSRRPMVEIKLSQNIGGKKFKEP